MASTLAYADSARATVGSPSRRVAITSALLATACVIGLVEAAVPGLPFAPWLRLGLANVAVVIALAAFGLKAAAPVSLGRVVVVGLATGSLLSPASVMAAAGAVCALVVMWALKRCVPSTTAVGWSAAGSAAHVAAQFVVASALLGSSSIIVLAPVSVLVALILGAVVGYLARIVASRLHVR